MSDLSVSEVPYANNELVTDISNESDVLKIDTFDKLDELLHTAGKNDLATIQQVNFTYNVDDLRLDKGLELRTARFLGALPQLQTLQLDQPLQLDQTPHWHLHASKAMGQLLQRAIAEASATSFRELKIIIWGLHPNPLDEMLPLWGLPVEHIEVGLKEPVSWSHKPWPAPNLSLRRLNLHSSTIKHSTLEKLLHLSPLEVLRYHRACDVSAPQDSSLLMAALRQVQSTLRELHLSINLFSQYTEDVEEVRWIFPVSGQLGPLEEFSPDRDTTRMVTEQITHACEGGAHRVNISWPHRKHVRSRDVVLKELAAFLSDWRGVTPDLQTMEVWLTVYRWDNAKLAKMQKMCEEAQKSGLSFILHRRRESDGIYSSRTFHWVRGIY